MISTRSLAHVRFHLLFLSTPTLDEPLCITSYYNSNYKTLQTLLQTGTTSIRTTRVFSLTPIGMYKSCWSFFDYISRITCHNSCPSLYANTTLHLDVTTDRGDCSSQWPVIASPNGTRTRDAQPLVCVIMTRTIVMVSPSRTGVLIFDLEDVWDSVQVLACVWAISGKVMPINTRNL